MRRFIVLTVLAMLIGLMMAESASATIVRRSSYRPVVRPATRIGLPNPFPPQPYPYPYWWRYPIYVPYPVYVPYPGYDTSSTTSNYVPPVPPLPPLPPIPTLHAPATPSRR
jgi:hypothetical protein